MHFTWGLSSIVLGAGVAAQRTQSLYGQCKWHEEGAPHVLFGPRVPANGKKVEVVIGRARLAVFQDHTATTMESSTVSTLFPPL